MFTIGPWLQTGHSVISRGRGIIAVCPGPKEGGCFEVMDNLRLIANSQELLECVEELTAFVRIDRIYSDGEQKALIKKAERLLKTVRRVK